MANRGAGSSPRRVLYGIIYGMFIKLTRLNNTPIWLNASFIVTVEPRSGGGAIVVPIGDGLDYDVKETPETVLAMLDGAPVPAVVPVPVSDCLTQTPDDVSPEPETPVPAPVESAPEVVAEPKPHRRAAAAKAKSSGARRAKSAAKKAEEPTAPVSFSDEQVERLRKMAPKSVGKLKNTLVSQFKVTDADAVVADLVARKAMSITGNHVAW